MGCCMSSTKKPKCRNNKKGSKSEKASIFNESRAPPPSTLEEDTIVKEVVNVTSVNQTPLVKEEISKPILKLDQQEDTTTTTNKLTQKVPVFSKIKDTHLLYTNNNNKAQTFNNCTTPTDVSEVSEICSVSTTTTATTTRDNIDFDEVSQRPRNRHVTSRSPATGGRNRVGVGKSPNRRPEQSPMRRNGSGQNQGMVKRVGSKTELSKRDPGESSMRRRSRSPAVNRSSSGVMGRSQSPSVKRNSNKSPVRVRSGPVDTRKMEEGCGNNNNDNNGVTNSNTNESLENPLVSLECFIFL
ncbi:hypothetical protein ACFE04_001596 [Oxalis oulophora]